MGVGSNPTPDKYVLPVVDSAAALLTANLELSLFIHEKATPNQEKKTCLCTLWSLSRVSSPKITKLFFPDLLLSGI